MCPLWIKTLVVWVLLIVVDGDEIKQTSAPLFPHKPFVVLWNAPTEQCQQRYKVDLDLAVFDIIANPGETLNGPIVTIYYHNQLGTYPYIEDNGVSINGGIPQNESLFNHLIKARSDINNSIPMKSFQGLAVIDWEDWRPQWIRNWGTKDIYRNKSIQLVQMSNSQWLESKIKDTAKDEFERSGKNFMNETLFLAKEMRSGGYWGYYLYPDCYNYDYKNNSTRYTGKCPHIEIKRNDELLWLWQQSTALYPSIYLDAILQSSPNALKFVHYRVKEAMRIASIARTDYALPVYVYGRPFYSWTLKELTEEDLVSTIGESAALGAAGVVLWGSMQYASTRLHGICPLDDDGSGFSSGDYSYHHLTTIPRDNCVAVKKYVNGPLGHYIVNVTYAAKLCSRALCQKNGRCIRKNSDSYDFLHLPSDSFKISIDKSQTDKKVTVQGNLKQEDVQAMKDKFHCQCYQGWKGLSCETSSSTNTMPFTKLNF